MDMNVIRWKLNELMAKKRVRNKDLADVLGITENSVYRLRRTDEMPRLSPERLNGLCEALSCQPEELLEWIPDNSPVNQTNSETQIQSSSVSAEENTNELGEKSSNRMGLRVVPKVRVLESA